MSVSARTNGHVYRGDGRPASGVDGMAGNANCAPRRAFVSSGPAGGNGETQQVEQPKRIDEVGVTLRAIGQLGLMFRWLINDVSSQAVSVLNAADALCKGNDSLSRQTDQAAANVQQTAATMNELAATVKAIPLPPQKPVPYRRGRVKRRSRAAK